MQVIGAPVVGGTYAGPIQGAVADYLLMERKAKAWDAFRSDVNLFKGVTYRSTPINEFLDALLDY